MDVILRIRHYMQLYGWTEYRLAKESGLAQSTISNIFLRNTIPSIPTLEIICRAFGITLGDFFAEISPTQAEQNKVNAIWKKLTPKQQKIVFDLIQELAEN